MKWEKIGKIFEPDKNYSWMYSHASVPFAEKIKDDVFKIYFSCRNKSNESSVGFVLIDLKKPDELIEISSSPVLSKGDLGTFDDSGVMGSCLVDLDKKKYMYYIGWNLGVTVPFRNAIGLAESLDSGATFQKKFAGPVLDRTKDEPHFVASNCVIMDQGVFKIWYLSCTGWEKNNNNITHHYHIKYAESSDGIDWRRDGVIAIDYIDQFEYAISVPRVIKEKNIYKMWFSSRGSKRSPTYRIRYAESDDGVHWVRKDNEVGIDVSDAGWDSEMICYPFVFDHSGDRYMLYNGNGYGKTGFGLAILND